MHANYWQFAAPDLHTLLLTGVVKQSFTEEALFESLLIEDYRTF